MKLRKIILPILQTFPNYFIEAVGEDSWCLEEHNSRIKEICVCVCSVLHPNLSWLLLIPSDVCKGRTTQANTASSKQMLWTRSSVVFPHPVRTPDSNLQNNKLKLSCHMYRCSASFRIGWASSLCLNKPQIKWNNNLICLQSMANFENAELDYKQREKKQPQQQQKKNPCGKLRWIHDNTKM